MAGRPIYEGAAPRNACKPLLKSVRCVCPTANKPEATQQNVQSPDVGRFGCSQVGNFNGTHSNATRLKTKLKNAKKKMYRRPWYRICVEKLPVIESV
jgi:hypothetical protein